MSGSILFATHETMVCQSCDVPCETYLARWPGRAKHVWRRCSCCGRISTIKERRWLPHGVLIQYGVQFEQLPIEDEHSELPLWVQIRDSEFEQKGLSRDELFRKQFRGRDIYIRHV